MAAKINTENAWAIIAILCVGTFAIFTVYNLTWGSRWSGYPGSNKAWDVMTYTAADRAQIMLQS
jgi:hypothetical protein